MNELLNLKSQGFLLILFLVFLILSWEKRKLILIGSALACPLAFIQWIYTDVWRADHLFGFHTGIEDFSFCFMIGGLSIALVNLAGKKYFDLNYHRFSLKRFLLVSLLGSGVLLGLYLLDIKNYLNSFICMGITVTVLCILQKELIKFFLIGSLMLFIIYIPALNLGFLIWPDLIELWDIEKLSGIIIIKVPLEENIWTLMFGGTWPVIIQYVTGKSSSGLDFSKT